MKIKKKRKGSSLIFVLAMAAIFTIISGVAASAVVATTKANSGEKIWEDLLYTSEAGVENAVTKAYQGIYNTQIPNYGNTMSFRLGPDPASGAITTGPFGDLKISVFVEVTKSGDLQNPDAPFDAVTNKYVNTYYKVKSTSTYKPMATDEKKQVRSIGAKILRTVNNTDIFKYALCGESVSAIVGGSISSPSAPINSSKDPAVIGGGSVHSGKLDDAEFTVPNMEKIDRLDGTLEFTSVSQLDDVSNYIQKKVITDRFGGSYNIYLVNAKTLKFTMTNFILENSIVICNGTIELNVAGGNQSYSSMIAKEVKMMGRGAINVSFPPTEADLTHSQSKLDKPQITLVNEFIAEWSSNWSSDPSTGGGTSVDYWGSISYEY